MDSDNLIKVLTLCVQIFGTALATVGGCLAYQQLKLAGATRRLQLVQQVLKDVKEAEEIFLKEPGLRSLVFSNTENWAPGEGNVALKEKTEAAAEVINSTLRSRVYLAKSAPDIYVQESVFLYLMQKYSESAVLRRLLLRDHRFYGITRVVCLDALAEADCGIDSNSARAMLVREGFRPRQDNPWCISIPPLPPPHSPHRVRETRREVPIAERRKLASQDSGPENPSLPSDRGNALEGSPSAPRSVQAQRPASQSQRRRRDKRRSQ